MIPDQGQSALRETTMRTMTNSILAMELSSIRCLAELNLCMPHHMINLVVDRMPSHMVDER